MNPTINGGDKHVPCRPPRRGPPSGPAGYHKADLLEKTKVKAIGPGANRLGSAAADR
jgi:hypothetical protein